MVEIILAVVIIAAVAAAITYLVRKRKKGQCVGCGECDRASGCGGCPYNKPKPPKH